MKVTRTLQYRSFILLICLYMTGVFATPQFEQLLKHSSDLSNNTPQSGIDYLLRNKPSIDSLERKQKARFYLILSKLYYRTEAAQELIAAANKGLENAESLKRVSNLFMRRRKGITSLMIKTKPLNSLRRDWH